MILIFRHPFAFARIDAFITKSYMNLILSQKGKSFTHLNVAVDRVLNQSVFLCHDQRLLAARNVQEQKLYLDKEVGQRVLSQQEVKGIPTAVYELARIPNWLEWAGEPDYL